MRSLRLSAQPHPTIGVELDGNVAGPLSHEDLDVVRSALATRKLVIFRNQHLTGANQRDFLASLQLGPVVDPSSDGELISNVHPDGYLGSQALAFHSDKAFSTHPERVISLHALDVSGTVASTRFADTAAVLGRFPEKFLSRARRVHIVNVMNQRIHSPARFNEIDPSRPRRLLALVGPLAGAGPVTICASEGHTAYVSGFGEASSLEFLSELFGYLYHPDNVYEHAWQPGDLLIWNNGALQHGRREVADRTARTLQRAVVADQDMYTSHPELAARRLENANRGAHTS